MSTPAQPLDENTVRTALAWILTQTLSDKDRRYFESIDVTDIINWKPIQGFAEKLKAQQPVMPDPEDPPTGIKPWETPTPVPQPAAEAGGPETAGAAKAQNEKASTRGKAAPELAASTAERPTRADWDQYRKLGWSVIPVKADKKPPVRWKVYQTRHATDEEVEAWVKAGYFIAVATGAVSGIFDAEYDEQKPDRADELPTTASQKSRRGKHFLFKSPGRRVPNDVKLRGFDIRGDGGYFIVPPFVDGRKWIVPPEEGIAEAPAWLLEPEAPAASNGDRAPEQGYDPNPEVTRLLREGVDHPGRNAAAIKVAGDLVRGLTKPYEIERAWLLFEDWNRQKVRPPLGTYDGSKGGDRDRPEALRTIFESACKEEREKHSLNGYNDLAVRSLRMIIDDPKDPPEMLVNKLVVKGDVFMIAGPTYGGKSGFEFVLGTAIAVKLWAEMKGLDLECSVLGYPEFVVPKGAPVVLFFAEHDAASWELALRQSVKHYENVLNEKRRAGTSEIHIDPKEVPFFLVDARTVRTGGSLKFTEAKDLQWIIEKLQQIRDQYKRSPLVFFDPLLIFTGVNDEDAAAENVKAARGPLDQVIAGTGATVGVTQHSTKEYLPGKREPQSAAELVRGSGDIIAMTSGIIGIWFSGTQKDSTKLLTQLRGPRMSPRKLLQAHPPAVPGVKPVTIEGMAQGELDPDNTPGIRPFVYAGKWESVSGLRDQILAILLQHEGALYTDEEIYPHVLWTGEDDTTGVSEEARKKRLHQIRSRAGDLVERHLALKSAKEVEGKSKPAWGAYRGMKKPPVGGAEHA